VRQKAIRPQQLDSGRYIPTWHPVLCPMSTTPSDPSSLTRNLIRLSISCASCSSTGGASASQGMASLFLNLIILHVQILTPMAQWCFCGHCVDKCDTFRLCEKWVKKASAHLRSGCLSRSLPQISNQASNIRLFRQLQHVSRPCDTMADFY
jgi:hypothetical protein